MHGGGGGWRPGRGKAGKEHRSGDAQQEGEGEFDSGHGTSSKKDATRRRSVGSRGQGKRRRRNGERLLLCVASRGWNNVGTRAIYPEVGREHASPKFSQEDDRLLSPGEPPAVERNEVPPTPVLTVHLQAGDLICLYQRHSSSDRARPYCGRPLYDASQHLISGGARARSLPDWPATRPLRAWQKEATEAVRAHSGASFLASATPAAGKTTFGLHIAHRM